MFPQAPGHTISQARPAIQQSDWQTKRISNADGCQSMVRSSFLSPGTIPNNLPTINTHQSIVSGHPLRPQGPSLFGFSSSSVCRRRKTSRVNSRRCLGLPGFNLQLLPLHFSTMARLKVYRVPVQHHVIPADSSNLRHKEAPSTPAQSTRNGSPQPHHPSPAPRTFRHLSWSNKLKRNPNNSSLGSLLFLQTVAVLQTVHFCSSTRFPRGLCQYVPISAAKLSRRSQPAPQRRKLIQHLCPIKSYMLHTFTRHWHLISIGLEETTLSTIQSLYDDMPDMQIIMHI